MRVRGHHPTVAAAAGAVLVFAACSKSSNEDESRDEGAERADEPRGETGRAGEVEAAGDAAAGAAAGERPAGSDCDFDSAAACAPACASAS